MADQGQPSTRPAGWKKDPSGRHFGRWWDGEKWTENVISSEKVVGVDPLPGQIPAGGAIRGLAVFEIPEGTTGMRLRVQGNITASGAFFNLT